MANIKLEGKYVQVKKLFGSDNVLNDWLKGMGKDFFILAIEPFQYKTLQHVRLVEGYYIYYSTKSQILGDIKIVQ